MEMLDAINEAMTRAIADAKLNGEHSACYTHNTNDGYIDIWCDRYDKEVVVCHDDNDHDCPNIVQAIEDILPEWDDIEIEEECYWLT